MCKIRRAFTLIEIMIVLLIVGIGVFTIAPVISERVSVGDELSGFFSALLAEHHTAALEQGAPVTIIGFKGSSNIMRYDGTRTSIPGVRSIQSAEINGRASEGLEYHITVYPDGICDHFILDTDQHRRIESVPLLMTAAGRSL